MIPNTVVGQAKTVSQIRNGKVFWVKSFGLHREVFWVEVFWVASGVGRREAAEEQGVVGSLLGCIGSGPARGG